jgi:hypothetical protein
VFCGEPGVTKGHVWPSWFGKILPISASFHENRSGEFFTFASPVPGPEKTISVKQGHARSRKLRNTCKACNQRWMSIIEGHAVSVTAPLLRGEPVLLDLAGQFALSNLLCLISMRHEFLSHSMRAIPQEDRNWLRTKFQPPDHWRIWIAKFTGKNPHDHWSRHCGIQIAASPAENVGPEYCNTHVSTMVMGNLCAHIFSSTEWRDFQGYEGIQLTQIWPPIYAYIDAGHIPSVTDKAVLWLHEAVARSLDPYPETMK